MAQASSSFQFCYLPAFCFLPPPAFLPVYACLYTVPCLPFFCLPAFLIPHFPACHYHACILLPHAMPACLPAYRRGGLPFPRIWMDGGQVDVPAAILCLLFLPAWEGRRKKRKTKGLLHACREGRQTGRQEEGRKKKARKKDLPACHA